MQRENDFTQGKILGPLLTFMLPVFFAMLLQSMYGAVDLMIVGKFAEALVMKRGGLLEAASACSPPLRWHLLF